MLARATPPFGEDSMTKNQNLFFSCVDSRIEDQGTMYARFHLGTFFQGHALTFANAIRRTLLSEIPALVITDVSIVGTNHKFATLSGVEETVLEVLLNLKKLVFVPCKSKLTELENFQEIGFLKGRGPRKLTAKNIKLPTTVKCVNPNAHIATLTTSGDFALQLTLQIQNPHEIRKDRLSYPVDNNTRKLVLGTVPMPIRKVNYVIQELDPKQESEYVVLEIWTDGSVLPQDSLQFALKNLTNLFFGFISTSMEEKQ